MGLRKWRPTGVGIGKLSILWLLPASDWRRRQTWESSVQRAHWQRENLNHFLRVEKKGTGEFCGHTIIAHRANVKVDWTSGLLRDSQGKRSSRTA